MYSLYHVNEVLCVPLPFWSEVYKHVGNKRGRILDSVFTEPPLPDAVLYFCLLFLSYPCFFCLIMLMLKVLSWNIQVLSRLVFNSSPDGDLAT